MGKNVQIVISGNPFQNIITIVQKDPHKGGNIVYVKYVLK